MATVQTAPPVAHYTSAPVSVPPGPVTAPAPLAAVPTVPVPATPPPQAAVQPTSLPQTPLPARGVTPDAPAFGSTVSRIVPFAGEMVPLPAGDWVTVAALGGKLPNGNALNAVMLAQSADGRVTAIMILNGVGAPSSTGTGFPRVPSCQESRNVYSRVFVDRDGAEQACWSVDAAAIPWTDASNRLRASAAAELQQRGLRLPEIVVRARFVRADKSHLLVTEIEQTVDVSPEGPGGWDWSHIMATPERLARMTRLRDWAAGWWPLIDRGFSGHLIREDTAASPARLPS